MEAWRDFDRDDGLARELLWRSGSDAPDNVAESVVPPRVDDDVRRQRRPVDLGRELHRARKGDGVWPGQLTGVRIVLVDADDRGLDAGVLAVWFEVRELCEPGEQDEDRNRSVDQQGSVERAHLVDRGR